MRILIVITVAWKILYFGRLRYSKSPFLSFFFSLLCFLVLIRLQGKQVGVEISIHTSAPHASPIEVWFGEEPRSQSKS
jgi:hypothetical protein